MSTSQSILAMTDVTLEVACVITLPSACADMGITGSTAHSLVLAVWTARVLSMEFATHWMVVAAVREAFLTHPAHRYAPVEWRHHAAIMVNVVKKQDSVGATSAIEVSEKLLIVQSRSKLLKAA